MIYIRDQCWAAVSAVINLQVSKVVGWLIG
jgi:hypothetical protein